MPSPLRASFAVDVLRDVVRLLVDVVDGQTSDQVTVLVDGSVVRPTHAAVIIRAYRVVCIARRIAGPRCGRLQRITAAS